MNRNEYVRMYEVEDSHWWYVGLHELIMRIIRRESMRLGRPLQILDAGCGTGRLCQLMAAEGHSVEGCDASTEALRFCRLRGINSLVAADLNTVEIQPEKLDVITSIDVLYHTDIVDDVEVFRRFWDGLRPGGTLILNLVAYEFLRSRHDIAVHTRERYTKRSLSRRISIAGFNIERVSYRVSILFPFIAVYRLLSRFAWQQAGKMDDVVSDVVSPHPLINTLLLKTMELENILLRMTSLPFGSSLFAVARKPLHKIYTDEQSN